MPGKKKKFIDKKNAVTFHLVHRSQRDPLQADDDAPQRVLLPADGAHRFDEKHMEEQRKFGVFYDDDYDYMQHLRDVDELNEVEPIESFRGVKSGGAQLGEGSGKEKGIDQSRHSINLPSSVFGSTAETGVGLLNKAAPVSGPRPDWDPDIVAALDEDFNYDDPDNQLDDDFMAAANQEGDGDYMEEPVPDLKYSDENDADVYRPVKLVHPVTFSSQIEQHQIGSDVASDEADLSDNDSDVGSLERGSFGDLDTRSRFTDYSMTSSVTSRNKGLTLLDDRFEKFYEQYDDEDIGALDHEDIVGGMKADNLVLTQAMEEFEQEQHKPKLKDAMQKGDKMDEQDDDKDDDEDDDEKDDDDLVWMEVRKAPEKWDCESILSTHSTLYNHPTLISEPRNKNIELTKRAGLPADVLPTRGLTRKQLEEIEQTQHRESGDQANTYRPRGETTEDRKIRKQAIKEERKGRREQKKSNKMVFKNEEIRQQKETMNLKHNLAGISLT